MLHPTATLLESFFNDPHPHVLSIPAQDALLGVAIAEHTPGKGWAWLPTITDAHDSCYPLRHRIGIDLDGGSTDVWTPWACTAGAVHVTYGWVNGAGVLRCYDTNRDPIEPPSLNDYDGSICIDIAGRFYEAIADLYEAHRDGFLPPVPAADPSVTLARIDAIRAEQIREENGATDAEPQL